MRAIRIQLFALFGLTLSATAQNVDFYGMKGQPLSLMQNPAAQTDLRFHLSLPGGSTQGNLTTPLRDLWGNVPEQIRNLAAPNVGLSMATDIEGVGIGWKGKKSYTWVQTGVDIDAGLHLDKDLIAFGFFGMKDQNGNIDPNFYADFSASDLGLSAMGRVTIGRQQVLSEKLRVGLGFQVNRLLGGFQWQVDEWSFQSSSTPTGTNALTWNSDMRVSAFGLIADAAKLDSAMDFPRYLLMGMVPDYLDLLKAQTNSYSLNLGLLYTPTAKLTLSASANGIPLSAASQSGGILNSRSLRWTSNFSYDGFMAGFSPQDTGTVAYYLTNLQSQVVDGFQIEGAPASGYRPTFSAHVASYYRLTKRHQVGLHLAHVDRLAGVHQSLGMEYHGFYGRKLQFTAAYRLHQWAGLSGASEISTVIQHRILPWTTLYWGTNLWMYIPKISNGSLLLPASFQSWQVTAGVNVTLFEKRYKEEHAAKKAAKNTGKNADKQNPSNTPILTSDSSNSSIHF